MSIQLTIADAEQAVKLQMQAECSHDFIIIEYFDFECDRVYLGQVCRKCNYTKD